MPKKELTELEKQTRRTAMWFALGSAGIILGINIAFYLIFII